MAEGRMVMNVRVISVTTLDGTNQDGPGTLYDGITGFLGFVPEIFTYIVQQPVAETYDQY